MIKERFRCIFTEAYYSFLRTSVPLLLLFCAIGTFINPAWFPTMTILVVFVFADLIFGCGVAKERFRKPD